MRMFDLMRMCISAYVERKISLRILAINAVSSMYSQQAKEISAIIIITKEWVGSHTSVCKRMRRLELLHDVILFWSTSGHTLLLLLPSKLKLRITRLQMSKVTNATDGEEPIHHYPCPVCAFSTVYRNSIQRHVKLNHPAVAIAKGKRGPHASMNSEVIYWFMI
jgi:hypothetical protein